MKIIFLKYAHVSLLKILYSLIWKFRALLDESVNHILFEKLILRDTLANLPQVKFLFMERKVTICYRFKK